MLQNACWENICRLPISLKVDGKEIKSVNNQKYHGDILTSHGRLNENIDERYNKGLCRLCDKYEESELISCCVKKCCVKIFLIKTSKFLIVIYGQVKENKWKQSKIITKFSNQKPQV